MVLFTGGQSAKGSAIPTLNEAEPPIREGQHDYEFIQFSPDRQGTAGKQAPRRHEDSRPDAILTISAEKIE